VRRWWLLFPLALGGLWLWYGAGGLFPSTRTLTCTLEDTRPVAKVEFQLWREETLLLRTVLQNPGNRSWTQEVPLKPGRHRVQLFAWASEGEAPRVHEQFWDVGDEREWHLRFW
jgi:hypothetical protein